jgi:hypothetical protein
MPCHHPFPKSDAVQQVLSDLLGREITITTATTQELGEATTAVVSDFLDGDGVASAVCITDLRLSNALGAALTMVPASAVEAAVQKDEIDSANLENLTEVVNVMARLFNHDDCAPLRWKNAIAVPGELAADVSALIANPAARRDFHVEVEEYGAGTLSILVG